MNFAFFFPIPFTHHLGYVQEKYKTILDYGGKKDKKKLISRLLLLVNRFEQEQQFKKAN